MVTFEMAHFETALVTGASAGLGEEFARQLAPRVSRLVLVARRAERLASLAQELQQSTDCEVVTIAVDLASGEGREELFSRLEKEQIWPDFLVNNAGLGDYGSFDGADWAKVEQMLEVNVTALTHVSHAVIPRMMEAGGGHLLNVSSLASVIPMPDFAVYAATKAFVTSFSEALHIELKPYGIGVTALCPGPVPTEFGQVASRSEENEDLPRQPQWMRIHKCQAVAEALSAVEQGRPRHYPGWQVALLAGALTAIPMFLLRPLLSSRSFIPTRKNF